MVLAGIKVLGKQKNWILLIVLEGMVANTIEWKTWILWKNINSMKTLFLIFIN